MASPRGGRTRAVLAALLATPAAAGAAVVAFEVTPLEEADRGGVRVGDLLLSWSVADGRSPALPPAGDLHDPQLFARVLREHGSRVPVGLTVEREGRRLNLVLEPGTWGVAVRPELAGADLDRFDEGRARIGASDEEVARSGLRLWAELAADWRGRDPSSALWLDLRRAAQATERNWPPEARQALADARVTAAASGDVRAAALVAEQLGAALERAGEHDAARAAFEENRELLREMDPGSLALARAVENLGRVAWRQDRLDDAEALHREALAIRAAVAPDGLPVAESYNDLGLVAWNRGNLDLAESYHRQALALRRRLAPLGLKTAYSLVNLGIVAWKRGDMAGAEAAYDEAREIYERLRPEGPEMARLLTNLGLVRASRGRLDQAEALYLRSLALKEGQGFEREVAHTLTNLGLLASYRGQGELAERYLRRSLEIKQGLDLRVDLIQTLLALAKIERGSSQRESLLQQARSILEADSPDSLNLAEVLHQLGLLALEQDRPPDAERLFGESLALARGAAPGSLIEARILQDLGELELAEGRDEGFAKLRTALDLVLAVLPGDSEEARARHRIARALLARGAADEALAMYATAGAVLDAILIDREGGFEERARHGASWAEIYFDHLDLLLRLERSEEAFALVERYRARELARMLIARDPEFPELPPELERRRQIAQTRFRRLLSARRDAPLVAAPVARDELLGARRDLMEIEAEIARIAPRVAELRRPSALDLDGARRVLDGGTLLLSYVVGPDRSWLLVLGPGKEGLAAVPIDAGRGTLALRVRELTDSLARPGVLTAWRIGASRLAELLLAPAAARIGRADRLLVLPDGPLHFLPFAALPLPGTDRLLVEAKPIHYAASMTVLGELTRVRAGPRPARVAIFADPRTGGDAAAGVPDPGASAASLRRRFEPLPASRAEAERIRRLFREAAIWLGDEATERRAKSIGADVTHLHFACHARADPRAPLESGLALATSGGADDDGFLQAWEILEQVRLEADLVVLSACETALGEELPGEGVLGLVGAFQFAGARAVLATQWRIADRSAADLAVGLYERLRAGLAAADALREAQLGVAGRPATAHPYYWAAFQLFGDGH